MGTSNIFENVTAYANGGGGIYMDVCSAGYQLSRNLVHSVAGSPIIWNQDCVPRQGVPTRITNNVLIANRDNDYSRSGANGTRKPQSFHFWGQGNPVFDWNGWTTTEMERNVIVVDSSRSPSRGEWFGGNPCASEDKIPESSSCTWDYGDNFKMLQSSSNVWHNASSSAEPGPSTFPGEPGSSKFPGGCNITGPKTCASDCVCQSWVQWQESGQETSSKWVDPGLTGPLKLVSEQKVL